MGLAKSPPERHGLDYLHEHGVHLCWFVVENEARNQGGDWRRQTDAIDKARRTLPHFIQEKPGGTFDTLKTLTLKPYNPDS